MNKKSSKVLSDTLLSDTLRPRQERATQRGGAHTELDTGPIHINNLDTDVTEEKIINILEMAYKNTAFSTFPYFYHGFNSKEAITHTKSGNCIALSLYMQQKLKDEYGINSCLIPATIPEKYRKVGYLDISHVALLIPIDNSDSDNGFFIADPAFYFLNPIEINIKDFTPKIVFSKNIYTPETGDNPSEYVSIDRLLVTLEFFSEDHYFNKWQTIKKGTYYVNCHEVSEPGDSWNYFLTEILNPDEAITSFFLDHQVPFITTVVGDKNGLPGMGGYLTIKDNTITYSNNLKGAQTWNIDDLTPVDLDKINKDLYPFFRGNVQNYLNKL